jgi:hypothetical protein
MLEKFPDGNTVERNLPHEAVSQTVTREKCIPSVSKKSMGKSWSLLFVSTAPPVEKAMFQQGGAMWLLVSGNNPLDNGLRANVQGKYSL